MKPTTATQHHPEVAQQLRLLRLSGVTDSLDIRIRQAIDEKLSHLEFLQMLLGDELARRDQTRSALLLKKASLISSKTIEQFDFAACPTLNRSLVSDLLTCRFMGEACPVLICGPTGTGKSHLAQAIGHQAIRQGKDVLFITQKSLLGYLHKARITGQYDRKFAKLVKVSLLIIDDYGLYPMTSPQDEDFHELVAHRYEQRSTIITSNLEFGEWDQAFARNKLLATATLDRLLHNAYRLTLQGKSYRKPRDVKKTDVARG
ncbi:IS21-like element helper ATPase IstB [Zwartia vadi]|uniref:IS21-like element helper ATPase IstB n=1 Tax=Zwartia vadi TaxID=3058168 RepID=UPI0025B3EC9F|nr:IS21-like element helper ATPase IstB [Zwartia vadi]MDN3988667.1 IS21-like element helper ATPase IstB [Zwartia vadi]